MIGLLPEEETVCGGSRRAWRSHRPDVRTGDAPTCADDVRCTGGTAVLPVWGRLNGCGQRPLATGSLAVAVSPPPWRGAYASGSAPARGDRPRAGVTRRGPTGRARAAAGAGRVVRSA